MTTRGIEQLKKAGVPFQELVYRHEDKGAKFAAERVGLEERRVIKTLVFQTDDRRFLLALMAADGAVSEKKLARVVGRKWVAPASSRDAERVTGYEIGGISPLGMKRPLAVVIDQELVKEGEVAINAGARGTLVRLATRDLVCLTGAKAADIRVE
jgi:Cys-tRNA(Pro)/Cys-tRNA(Cys) deacylase